MVGELLMYSNQNENLHLSGYKASLNQYLLGSIRNEYNFYKTENGVNLNIEVIKYIINYKFSFFIRIIHIRSIQKNKSSF